MKGRTGRKREERDSAVAESRRKRVLLLALPLVFLLLAFSAGFSAPAGWFNSSWHVRVPVNVSYPGGNENLSVNVTLNLTRLFSQANMSGAALDSGSLRVIENQTRLPLDWTNLTGGEILVTWIANGTVDANNRTFYVYFDSVANGPKQPGDLILDSIHWRSGYINFMNDNSPYVNNTTGAAQIPYNRSWAQRVEVSFKWAFQGDGFDKLQLYADGVQQGFTRFGVGSANESYWGSAVHGKVSTNAFGSFQDGFGANDTYGIYGGAIDTVKFYPVRNYTVVNYVLVSDSVEPQPSNATAAANLTQYNFNETLGVFGIVSDAGGAGIPGASVNASVFFPNGTLIASLAASTNASGSYAIPFLISWEAPNGTYSVNVSAAKSSFNTSFNGTTFYYTADKVASISAFSVTPGLGGWSQYYNFSANVSDFDENKDLVNVSLWVNTAASGWVKFFQQNLTTPNFTNWTMNPFGIGDIGTNRTFLFEFADTYHPAINTTVSTGPEIERDDVAVEFLGTVGSPIIRPGTGNASFAISLRDTDNGALLPVQTVRFYANLTDGSWLLIDTNFTDFTGNSAATFEPSCSSPFGINFWKANYSESVAYKAAESDPFVFNVTGQSIVNLTEPVHYFLPRQGDAILFQANVTDECSVPIPHASVNFTIVNVTNNPANFACRDAAQFGAGGLYNCTWNSSGANAGNYTVVINASQASSILNITSFENWFYLLTGPPKINLYVSPRQFDQLSSTVVTAAVTDFSGLNISVANITFTSPNTTVYASNMTLAAFANISGNWVFNYTVTFPGTWGSTIQRGLYSIYATAVDGIGSSGNKTDSATIYSYVNLTGKTDVSFYQADSTPRLVVNATDLFGVPIAGLLANLTVSDPSWIPLEFTNGVTQASLNTSANGTASKTFFLPAGSTPGVYTVQTQASFFEPLIDETIYFNRTAAFAVTNLTSLEAFLSFPPDVFLAKKLSFSLWVKNDVTYLKPDNFSVNFYYDDLNGTSVPIHMAFNLSKADFLELGGTYAYYYYSGTTPGWNFGQHHAVLEGTVGGTPFVAVAPFQVLQGGPFDVEIQALNSPVGQGNRLNVQTNITNRGSADQFDVMVTYLLDGVTPVGGGPVQVNGGTKRIFYDSLLVPLATPIGIHNMTVRVDYNGTSSPAVAFDLFVVTSASTTTAPPGLSGGGGFAGAGPIPEATTTSILPGKPTFGITISDYPRERDLFVERNSIKFFNVEVRNVGSETLHDIRIGIAGISDSWFEITASNTSYLDPDATANFVVRLVVPNEAKAQTYPITISASANETSTSKVTAVSVFASEKERLFYEIQFLKSRYTDLQDALAIAVQNNKNVSDIVDIMAQAKLQVDTAAKFVDDGALRNAGDAIRKAHNYLDRAEFELNRLPQVPTTVPPVVSLIFPVTAFPYFIALLIILLGIIVLIWVAKTMRRVKKIVKTEAAAQLRRALDTKKTPGDMIKSRERIKRFLSVIEGQYRDKAMSKETYEELRRENEKKLAVLSKELGMEDEIAPSQKK